MAACDYRLCDVCGAKAFYDANLNYEWIRPNSGPGLRNGGHVDSGLTLDRLGDWVVLCADCAQSHECKIVPKDTPTERTPQRGGEAEQALASLREVIDRRVEELAERLIKAGPKAAHVSASECHEITEAIHEARAILGAALASPGAFPEERCDG